jgi:hypothetical protein
MERIAAIFGPACELPTWICVAGPNPNTVYIRSRAVTSRSNACVSNPDPTSILRPLDNTTANPQLDLLSAAGFPVANSTPSNLHFAPVLFLFFFHRCFFRWRAKVLKLKPRLLQNSFCRMPLLANSGTNC